MYKFSIITPVYNRASLLSNIYQSLKSQKLKDFEWIIVDDGSLDNCKETVESFPCDFKITYVYQQNSGKHVAVNTGIDLADSVLTMILDSDDIMYDSNVLSLVWKEYNNPVFEMRKCVSIAGLCVNKGDCKIIGDQFPLLNFSYRVSNHITMRFNKHIAGDKCEFFLTKILRLYKFPVFPGEKFITEAIVWNRISQKLNTIYINAKLKTVEYLDDGLSAKSKSLFERNPKGVMLFYNENSVGQISAKYKLLHCFFYARISIKTEGFVKTLMNARNKLLIIPVVLMYIVCKIYASSTEKKNDS